MSARVKSGSRRSEFAPALDFSLLIKCSRTSIIRAQPEYEVKGDATIAAEASSSAVLPVEEHGDNPTDDEEEVPVKKGLACRRVKLCRNIVRTFMTRA
jgi:hypothetical protein